MYPATFATFRRIPDFSFWYHVSPPPHSLPQTRHNIINPHASGAAAFLLQYQSMPEEESWLPDGPSLSGLMTLTLLLFSFLLENGYTMTFLFRGYDLRSGTR
jgi:hypothetical protein